MLIPLSIARESSKKHKKSQHIDFEQPRPEFGYSSYVSQRLDVRKAAMSLVTN
jgi:hypothetical protein